MGAGESKKIENLPAEKDNTETDYDEQNSNDLQEKDGFTAEKKRKAAEETEEERPAKRLHIVDETLCPADDGGENNNSTPAAKMKLLGPKSRRKPTEDDKPLRKKLLGPKSKRKSYIPDEEEDSSEEQKIDEINQLFFRKKKPAKCNINMTSLFQK